ncbi:hypothetical protein V8C44DRAFT_367131 [Trichoderma aethiopicum]
MRPRSVALLAACIPLCLCDAKDPAPRCAVDCASNIRNDNEVPVLKAICGDKLMTNSLFQCLITSCPRDAYSPAVAHVILACSDLGIAIGPLYPVEVQHANLVKVQDLLAPSMPAAYGTPSDPSPQNPDQLTLSFDVSIDLKCNSGSDGLVTVSLPLPALPSSTASPALPSSVPIPDPGKGQGDGQGDNGGGVAVGDDDDNDNDNNGTGDNGNGIGDNGNGTGVNGSDDHGNGDNGNGDNGNGGNGHGDNGDGASSSPSKPTQASADPSATPSCPPDSASPNAQDPGDDQAPSPSTDGGVNGDPAATSAASGSPGSGDPASPASSPSPASPASSPFPASSSSPASSASPAGPASPASTSPCTTASPETGGLDPQDPNQSDPSSASAGEGEEPQAPATSPALPPASASSTATASSSSCSAADGTNASVDPVPVPQVSQTFEAPSAAPQSSSPQSSSPQSSPLPSSAATASVPSPSDASTDPSSGGPPNYSSAADFETSLPEPSTQPLPQENQGPGAQAPSYDQSGSTLRSLTILTDDAAVETAEGQSPSKTSEPSELTLWPTAKSNRTSSTTSAAGQHKSSTSSCESDGKETVTTAHTPRANLVLPSDGSRATTETVAEMLLMTVLNTAPSAPAAPTPVMSNESVFGSVSSNSLTQSAFSTSPTSNGNPAQSGEAAKESSDPNVALVNGVSRATPHLFTIALLIILVGGMLLN